MSAQTVFNSDGSLFAVLGGWNSLKVFSTDSGALIHHLTDSDHLALTLTSLAWGLTKKGKKKARQVIGVGTSKGNVVVWDIDAGKVVNRFSDSTGHAGSITGIDFVASSRSFVTSSTDGKVKSWSLETDGCTKTVSVSGDSVSAVCAVGSNKSSVKVYGAAGEVSSWDLSTPSGTLQTTWPGHSSAVSHISSLTAGAVVTAAQNDRFLSVWAEGSSELASATMAVPGSNVDSLYVHHPGGGDTPKVVVVSEGVHVSVFDVTSGALRPKQHKHHKRKTSRAPTTPLSTGSLPETARTTSHGNTVAILNAVIVGKEGNDLLFAFGSANLPRFARVPIYDDTGKEVESLNIGSAVSAGTSLAGEAAAEEDAVTAQSLREAANAAEDGVGARAAPISGDKKQSAGVGAGKQAKSVKGSIAALIAGRVNGGSSSILETEDNRKFVGSRAYVKNKGDLRSLQEAVDRLAETAEGFESQLLANGEAPSAQSLAVVLTQALQAHDEAVVKFVLSESRKHIVTGTVARLPTQAIVPLLKFAVGEFERRASRALPLVRWIRAAITVHAGYLMAVPSVNKHLAPLYAAVETRLAVFRRMLKLQGRLDLLLGQVRATSFQGMASNPPVVYNAGVEDSSDEEDSESDFSDDEEEGMMVEDSD